MISQDGFNKLALDGSQLKSVKGDDFLSDDFLDKDFFSDDNLQEDFISDMTAENNEAPLDEAVEDGAEGAAEGEDEGAVEDEDEGAVEDGDEGAVEDDDGKQTNDDVAVDDDTKKKDFLSDEHIQKDFLSEEHIQKDFLSDEHIQKDFFSDGHIEENFFSDDHLEKDFFSDDNTNSQGDVAANGLQSDNGDGGLKESDNAINEDVNDSADIKATPVEDNNDEIADSDRGNNNDEQNAGDTGVKKMWAVDSEEGKPFLDENFFSDDNIERRSMADKSQRYGANNHTDDKHAVTIEGETTKKGNDSSEDIKVLPTNVHNTRRQQNLHMLENEIR
ncbi:uncharacterized protein LOC134669777 isoform X2 [Cydia fagiglandana]|uniref:uncharacterized protein LOC134669777 isoform X2 n=1 Tax=Cydia fagiglandana TaxID=1458189 RepID=UPI002FEE046C